MSQAASRILWGSNYENVLDCTWPQWMDSKKAWRRPVAGSEQARGTSTQPGDTWIYGYDFCLTTQLRWFGRAAYGNPVGMQAFIDYAIQQNPFRFVPNTATPAFYVDACYLDVPLENPEPNLEPDGSQTLVVTIRNATTDFNQALRGIMFEYLPGMVLSDPAFGATFTRGGGCDFIDNLGLVQQAPDATARDRHYIGGQRTTALQATRTNLAIQSDALSTGWTVEAGLAVTPAYVTLGILALARITGLTAGAVYRTVTLTGNGLKSFSCIVQYDGATGVTHHGLWDNTSSAWLARAAVTWAADGTATCVANNGTLLAFEPLGTSTITSVTVPSSSYRIVMQSVSATAAHTHLLYATNQGSTTATSVRVGAMCVEDNAVPAIEPILTTTTAVTYNTERLYFPFNYAPQPMWWYVKFIERGTILAGLTQGVLGVGDSVAPALFLYETGTYGFQHRSPVGNVTEAAGSAPNYGDTVELLGLLFSDGSVQILQSINGGAETASVRSGAAALAPAWNPTTVLRINDRSNADSGSGAFQVVRVGAGVTVNHIAAARVA